jgi:predicted RNA-binding Zn-ribbon protein involved in translation (DUF1610 family)
VIRWKCRSCGRTLRVAGQYAGKHGTCPNCGAQQLVPAGRSSSGGRAEKDSTAGPAGPLVPGLHDPSPGVRQAAVRRLGDTDDCRAVAALVPLLKDPDTAVRWYTAEALGKWADVRTLEPLVATLTDPEATVAGQAALALLNILHKIESSTPEEADHPVRKRVRTELQNALQSGVFLPGAAKRVEGVLRGKRGDPEGKDARGKLRVGVLVFWEGLSPPTDREQYCRDVAKMKWGRPPDYLEAAWFVGLRPGQGLNLAFAAGLYANLKDQGQLPDLGPWKDAFTGTGPDGHQIAAFFF